MSTAGKPIYYVSTKRDVFTPLKLPKYTLPKVYIDLMKCFEIDLINNELSIELNVKTIGLIENKRSHLKNRVVCSWAANILSYAMRL